MTTVQESGNLPLKPSAPMFKMGLIGCGEVATYGHLPAIRQCSHLALHALYDPDPARLEAAGRQFGVARTYSDLETFFRSGIEAVVITSPAPVHKDNVMGAARHRLPVLCEKPLAMNPEEGEAMIAAMAQAGAPLYVAFCYRFSPVALRIRELLAAKAIGDVRSLRLIYNWNLHGKYTLEGGERKIQLRRKNRMLEGGPMIDCGTHQIDLARFWLHSEVVRFSGHGAWVEDYEAPDHMWVHLDHANGAHSMVEISYSYHQVSRTPRMEFVYELIGSEGVIRYDRSARSFTLDNAEGCMELPYAAEKNFEGMYEEFARALEFGSSSLLPGGRESLAVIKIASETTREAIRRRCEFSPILR